MLQKIKKFHLASFCYLCYILCDKNFSRDEKIFIMTNDTYNAAVEMLKKHERLHGKKCLRALSIANGYIARNLTDGMAAGLPQKAIIHDDKVWVVPIRLSRKTGASGEVGVILIDDTSMNVIGATTTADVLKQCEALLHEGVEVV
jgi:hypothetical protein